jgi:SAM-dependent methyltransferase
MEPELYHEMYQLEGSHWWYEGMRYITQRLLEAKFRDRRDLWILDAGCGTGRNLDALASFGCVFGLDYSSLALDYASREHPGQVSRATIEALPFPDSQFDLVTSLDVIVCKEIRNDVTALRELARVTKPGGYVLVRVAAIPQLKGAHDIVGHCVRRYTASELGHRFSEAGLLPDRLEYANSILMPAIFTARKAGGLLMRLGRAPVSDFNEPSKFVNRALASVLRMEGDWIASGRSFPAGVSLFGIARKPTIEQTRNRSVVVEYPSAVLMQDTTLAAIHPSH